MVRRDNLRKVFRLGSVGFVTASSDYGCVQLLGLHRAGIISVLGLGAMAGLAGDNHMLAHLLLVHYIAVAGLASAVPGKGNWSRCDLADRRTTIVAVLPKTARHHRRAQDHKPHQRYEHYRSQPNQVFNVL